MFDTGSLLLLMVVIISIRQNVQSHVRFFSEFVEEWNVTSYICMYRLSFGSTTRGSQGRQDASYGCSLPVPWTCSYHCSRPRPPRPLCPSPWTQRGSRWGSTALCWGLSKVTVRSINLSCTEMRKLFRGWSFVLWVSLDETSNCAVPLSIRVTLVEWC
jgi:hypothetical protein